MIAGPRVLDYFRYDGLDVVGFDRHSGTRVRERRQWQGWWENPYTREIEYTINTFDGNEYRAGKPAKVG